MGDCRNVVDNRDHIVVKTAGTSVERSHLEGYDAQIRFYGTHLQRVEYASESRIHDQNLRMRRPQALLHVGRGFQLGHIKVFSRQSLERMRDSGGNDRRGLGNYYMCFLFSHSQRIFPFSLFPEPEACLPQGNGSPVPSRTGR